MEMNVTKSNLLRAWRMIDDKLKQEQTYLGQWCTAAQATGYWGIVHEKTLEVFALELEQSAIYRSIEEMGAA